MPDTEDGDSGWVGYSADDAHGSPAASGNEHLTEDQRADLERQAQDVAAARGRHQAVVVIDIYENGEAVPHVQVPKESSMDMFDESQVAEAVARAAEALKHWQ